MPYKYKTLTLDLTAINLFEYQNKFTHNLQKRKLMETEVLQQYLYQHGLEFLGNRITKFTVCTGVRGVFTKDLL